MNLGIRRPPVYDLAKNTAEGGTDEATVTTNNSGGLSGTPWSLVSIGGNGASLVYDNAHQANGSSLSYRFTNGTIQGSLTQFKWDSSILGSNRVLLGGTIYTYVPTQIGGGFYTNLVLMAESGVNTDAFIWTLDASGVSRLRVGDRSGGSTDSTVVLAVNQLIRIEFAMICSTTVGSITARLYNNAASSVPDDTITRTGVNTGSLVNEIYFGPDGNQAGSGTPYTMWMDDISIRP